MVRNLTFAIVLGLVLVFLVVVLASGFLRSDETPSPASLSPVSIEQPPAPESATDAAQTVEWQANTESQSVQQKPRGSICYEMTLDDLIKLGAQEICSERFANAWN